MLKRLIIAAVGVAGLVVIGLGIASATLWRADDVLVARTSATDHVLVTAPGVLELAGDPVTARVEVPDGGHVVLAVGRDTDVAGWVGTDPHGQVTGLSGWHALAVEDGPAGAPAATDEPGTGATPPEASPGATATEAGAPTAGATAGAAQPSPAATTDAPAEGTPSVADPTGSDLWVAQAAGDGSAELVWPAQPGRWSLLAVSTGESAPTLSLAWPRVVTTPWLWPSVVLGALLVVLSAVLLLRAGVLRRREPAWHPVVTQAVPVVEGDPAQPLTRRQIREAEQAARGPRTGALPRVGLRSTPTPVVGPGEPADGSAAVERPTAVVRVGPPAPDAPPSGTSTSGTATDPAVLSDPAASSDPVSSDPAVSSGSVASSGPAASSEPAAPETVPASSGSEPPSSDTPPVAPEEDGPRAARRGRRALRDVAASSIGRLRPGRTSGDDPADAPAPAADAAATGPATAADTPTTAPDAPATAAGAPPTIPDPATTTGSASGTTSGADVASSGADPAATGPTTRPTTGAETAAGGGPGGAGRTARTPAAAAPATAVAAPATTSPAAPSTGAGSDDEGPADDGPDDGSDDEPLRPTWAPITSAPTASSSEPAAAPSAPSGRGRPAWLRMPFGSSSGGRDAAAREETGPVRGAPSSGALPVWLPSGTPTSATTPTEASDQVVPDVPAAATPQAEPGPVPPARPSGEPEPPGARADAWRRAWGLSSGSGTDPAAEPDAQDENEGREQR